MAKIVIKVGGALIRQPHGHLISQAIAQLVRNNHQVVLVHGGGPQLDYAIRAQNRVPEKVAGRRITSADDLQLAVRIWRGDISTQWIQQLSRQGISALGLTGQDARLIQASRRPVTKVVCASGVESEVDFGYVGNIQAINTEVLNALWTVGIVPVVAPLGGDENGQLLNINADTIATELAVSLNADELIFLSNIDGLLQDSSDPQTRIAHVDTKEARSLLFDGTIKAGMRPKVESIINALARGVGNVHIANGTKAKSLYRLLVKRESIGTHFANHSLVKEIPA